MVSVFRWFAKRFLHPAVVSLYEYIFLWDEDLEVDNFNPRRYHIGSTLIFLMFHCLAVKTE
jgi:hypothetical protein